MRLDFIVKRISHSRKSDRPNPAKSDTVRRSVEGEQHLSVSIVPGGVADRLAVIRKRVGRFDRRRQGAFHQGSELAVGADVFLRRAVQQGSASSRESQPPENEIED